MIPATLYERFVAKVDYDGPTPITRPDLGVCWTWIGAIDPKTGYGRFKGDNKSADLAHRWSHEHFAGPMPAGLTIDHLCLNHACVRPSHFEVVTREVNARRGNPNTYKTACKRGHEFTPENTIARKGGRRECLACKRGYVRAPRVRTRAA